MSKNNEEVDEYLDAIRYFHDEMIEESRKGMSKNEITGDRLVTKHTTDAYRDNYDQIFCKHDWCSEGDPGQGEVMVFTCSRCGKESRGVPAGYNKGEAE